MITTAPKLTELTGLVKEALEAAAYFSGVTVVKDEGQGFRAVEEALNGSGFCLVVSPVTEVTPREQAGDSWLADASIVVKLMINPEKNDAAGGAGKAYGPAIVAVLDAVTRRAAAASTGRTRHPGGEYFKFVGGQLGDGSAGLMVYDLVFDKEVLL